MKAQINKTQSRTFTILLDTRMEQRLNQKRSYGTEIQKALKVLERNTDIAIDHENIDQKRDSYGKVSSIFGDITVTSSLTDKEIQECIIKAFGQIPRRNKWIRRCKSKHKVM